VPRPVSIVVFLFGLLLTGLVEGLTGAGGGVGGKRALDSQAL